MDIQITCIAEGRKTSEGDGRTAADIEAQTRQDETVITAEKEEETGR